MQMSQPLPSVRMAKRWRVQVVKNTIYLWDRQTRKPIRMMSKHQKLPGPEEIQKLTERMLKGDKEAAQKTA